MSPPPGAGPAPLRRKITGSDTRMQRVHGDPCSLKSTSQFIRREEKSQLRLTIISQIGIVFLALQVVKFNGDIGVRGGTDIDNACWCARLQGLEQQLAEQKRGQVIDRQGRFKALGGESAPRISTTSIVHQKVQVAIGLLKFGR